MKKNWVLPLLAVVLAAVYAVCFTDWFKLKTIHISHTYRRAHARPQRDDAQPALIFALNPMCKLTEIKVVALSDHQIQPDSLPLWHVVSTSNSVPLRNFSYGQRIRGLSPEVPGTHPGPLTNGVVYRLIVTAGKITGEHDFELK